MILVLQVRVSLYITSHGVLLIIAWFIMPYSYYNGYVV